MLSGPPLSRYSDTNCPLFWYGRGSPAGGLGELARSTLPLLELEPVGDHGDELAVGGFSFHVGDCIAEVFLQGLQVAPVPGTSMAWRMARSTREAVVPKRLATSG